MGIKTYSAFVYGHTVTDDNKYINFSEGSGELSAEIEIGSYTLDAYRDAVGLALNGAGSLDYTVTVDRATRKLTVSASANFDLLIASGFQLSISAFPLMGFTGADLTGQASYQGDISSGRYFEPQLFLQSFVDFKDNVKTLDASVNQSASGAVEVVSYGTVKFMECNITLQTNIPQGKGSVLKSDVAGYDNLRSFLSYCITKAPIEFIPDVNAPSIYTDCLLESTRESKDGVDFTVKELYSRGFSEYYESGLITFRELI